MAEQISVTLSSSVVYVSGMVNGTTYTFTLSDMTEDGSVWTTDVERAENDVYTVEITAVDALGNTTNFSTVIYYGLQHLITDRTSDDVTRWKTLRDKGWSAMTDEEKAEWQTALKGAYNYVDMNRVESAVQYIADRMTELGYVIMPETYLVWSMSDFPTKADMDRYFGNVAALREMIAVYETTPKAPTTAKKFDYRAANDIEQILLDLDELLTKLTQSWHFAGEIIAGEV